VTDVICESALVAIATVDAAVAMGMHHSDHALRSSGGHKNLVVWATVQSPAETGPCIFYSSDVLREITTDSTVS